MSEKQEILKYSSLLPEKKRSKAERKTPLEPIAPPKGSRKKRRRVGRGHSSGSGKTSGRGHKGQKARTGYSERAGFEGGQMPLHRRLPKRGFRSIFKVVYQEVNLYRIEKAGVSGELTPEKMQAAGLIRDPMLRIKILGTGEAKGALQITADAFTEGARKKIEGAGGSCTTRNLDELRKQSKKKAASE